MGFQDFYGNSETVSRAREMLAAARFPHAVLLAGPNGAGKYTLAQMLAKAINCLAPPAGLPDFCGRCANCLRIAQADDLDARFAEAIEAREALREADRKDTRIFVQTHPDVLIVPPDPPQRLVKVGQVRRVIETIYFRPGEGRERVYIFPATAFMKNVSALAAPGGVDVGLDDAAHLVHLDQPLRGRAGRSARRDGSGRRRCGCPCGRLRAGPRGPRWLRRSGRRGRRLGRCAGSWRSDRKSGSPAGGARRLIALASICARVYLPAPLGPAKRTPVGEARGGQRAR